MQLSCDIITWFQNNYELTNDKSDVLKVKDVYDRFTRSHNFEHMTKADKRKYNKSYFVDYIATNRFFSKYYCIRNQHLKNFIKFWKFKESEDDDNNEFIDSD